MLRVFPIYLLFIPLSLLAQNDVEKDRNRVLEAVIIEDDTVPVVLLGPVQVEGEWTPGSKREFHRYTKLTKNVVKVYPYAKIASGLLAEYNRDLQYITSGREQKDYLKIAEAELKAEFEGEIRNMTISQGRTLIKLIDRETGDSSYELIKELKGSFAAFIWQTLARVFGSDLRVKYDPNGADAMMESIVRRIERGELYVPARAPMTAKAKKRLEKKKKKIYKKYGLDELKTTTAIGRD